MIVTRRRRKPFPWRRVVLPLIAIALVVFALSWAPSRNAIANGPLKPAFGAVAGALTRVAAPFTFAAQAKAIAGQKQQIATLQAQLASAQAGLAAKTKAAAALQAQIDQLQAQAAQARSTAALRPAPGPSGAGAAAPGAAFAPSGNLSPAVAADLRRTGSYWSSMDPSNAAKVVQRLPPSYVAQVFAQMSSDAVGAILDALPPAFAAKLTQANPTIAH